MRAITTHHQAISARLQRFKRYQNKPVEKFITINAVISKQNRLHEQTAQKSMSQIILMMPIFNHNKYHHSLYASHRIIQQHPQLFYLSFFLLYCPFQSRVYLLCLFPKTCITIGKHLFLH